MPPQPVTKIDNIKALNSVLISLFIPFVFPLFSFG